MFVSALCNLRGHYIGYKPVSTTENCFALDTLSLFKVDRGKISEQWVGAEISDVSGPTKLCNKMQQNVFHNANF